MELQPQAAPAPKKSKKPSVAERAAAHPDFAKWEAKAAEVEKMGEEEALTEERRAEASENRLYLEAKLYWLRRGIGADAEGWSAFGEHRRKPQELAKVYGVDVPTAEHAVTDTHAEVETFFAEENKKGGFDGMTSAAKKEIVRLEKELAAAA